MAERKQEPSFTVTDRRLFTSDGELRTDLTEETEKPKPTPQAVPPKETQAYHASSAPAADKFSTSDSQSAVLERDLPVPPTAAEQEAQANAYQQSSKDLDSRVELSGHSAKEFEMTFERFMASLYMSAMMQLGLMHEQGAQPRVDIIGARQTIDTLSLIAEKTKGNLTPAEQNFLQNSLYELRMAYVEVTNALSRPPAAPATGTMGR
jgi:uncharacterized protein DUF1844